MSRVFTRARLVLRCVYETTRHDQYQHYVSVTELAFVSGTQKAKNASEAGQKKRVEENGKEGNG